MNIRHFPSLGHGNAVEVEKENSEGKVGAFCPGLSSDAAVTCVNVRFSIWTTTNQWTLFGAVDSSFGMLRLKLFLN